MRTLGSRLAFVSAAACIAAAIQLSALGPQDPGRGRRDRVVVNGHEAVAGEVLVQFANAQIAAENASSVAGQVDATMNVPVGRHGLRRMRSRGLSTEQMLAAVQNAPGVVFAEPNYMLRATATPNDPQFGNLWGLLNIGQVIGSVAGVPGADIDATSAWDLSTGSAANVVGVIDSGIDYTHPDLAANMWSAPSAFTVTIGGVPITCPAGSHGFNAITRVCDPMDTDNHGTHVSGTIGARGNNGIGVAGVNWTTRIIGAKFLQDSVGSTSDAIDAVDFMVQTKAAFAATGGANIRVLSNSWGGGAFSTALRNAIANANASEMLFVAAAGNNGRDTDANPFYPAAYDLPNVVSVAATGNRDTLASFSNYGAATVDLAAPGVAVLSTIIGGSYAYFNGTSMATPHVSGAAALVLSHCPMNTAALKSTLLANVDVLGSLAGRVATNGRLNVNRAIRSCGSSGPLAPTGLNAIAGDAQVALAWAPSAAASSYKVKRGTSSGGPYSTIASGVTSTEFLDTSLTNGVTYFYVVTAINGAGESGPSEEASATPLPVPPSVPQNVHAYAGDRRVLLRWAPAAGADTYRVKRSLVKSGPFAAIAETAATEYVDTTVVNGTKYWYVVSAVNAIGESKNSKKSSAVPAAVPPPPTGLTASPGSAAGTIDLAWNTSPGATAYKIRRGTTAGGPYALVKKVQTASFTDAALLSGQRYYYVVIPINGAGAGAPSAEASAIAP